MVLNVSLLSPDFKPRVGKGKEEFTSKKCVKQIRNVDSLKVNNELQLK